jgi:hypothetical protein
MKKTPSADRRKKNGRAFAKKTAERKNHGQRELLRVTAAGKRPTGARCSRGHRIVLGRADCRTGESARKPSGKISCQIGLATGKGEKESRSARDLRAGGKSGQRCGREKTDGNQNQRSQIHSSRYGVGTEKSQRRSRANNKRLRRQRKNGSRAEKLIA